MATRGYSSYRGSGGGGKKLVWVLVLSLILLASLAFLFSQRYLVYDETGKAHWELPFHGGQSAPSQPADNPISPEDVTIERQDPEPQTQRPVLRELHARELENGSLWWDPAYVLSLVEESVMVEVKRASGGIAYATSVETAPGVVVERGVTRDNLTTLLQSDRYAVARVNCFRDAAYAEGRPESALTAASGGLWYDGDGTAWLDPADEDTLRYLSAICRECAQLGFDEILLDSFSYPTGGDQTALPSLKDADRAAVLTAFAAAIRRALPENVALSVTYRGEMGVLGGPCGLTAELLGSFDRIYVDEAVDRTALDEALPQTFDRAAGLVLLCRDKPASGGYTLLP